MGSLADLLADLELDGDGMADPGELPSFIAALESAAESKHQELTS